MTFLEVVTRTCKRPSLLANNKASLAAQTCDDFTHTIIEDVMGRGIGWAQANLVTVAPKLTGEYIWLLDDDDECIRPDLVAELHQIARAERPDVIMLRMDHGPLGVLPDNDYWGKRPAFGHVGCSAYVVKRNVWQAHANIWLNGRYYTDFEFINDVFDADPVVYWHDVIASRVQRISEGAPE